jgi:hypothetical protein
MYIINTLFTTHTMIIQKKKKKKIALQKIYMYTNIYAYYMLKELSLSQIM